MVTSKLGFAGRVAVITGAGGGLGKAYALEFARRGASIVVNDLGGSFKGVGNGSELADKVVKEIVDAGGKAVANYDSVENGEQIIETAIKSFGKVDILINNAGILRDRSFSKLSEEDWDKIFQVHVKGAFKVTKAAWPHMQKQKYGRIIMTTSPSGLYGNFGQTNYSAAKMALVGLANSLSIEGKKYNIHVNTVAPVAVTRMSEDVLPFTDLLPGHVAPFVVYMCHDSCMDTGSILETGGGFAGKIRVQRSHGAQLRQFVNDKPTVEIVADSWFKLSDFTFSSNPKSLTEASTGIVETVQNLPEHPIPVDATPTEKMKAFRFEDAVTMYTPDDVIQYALSVGASLPEDSKFLYEGHSEFSVLPSFAAVLGQASALGNFVTGIPGMEDIDVTRAVHGEQYTECFKPLPSSGKITSKSRISDAIDKRKFCQVIIENEIFDEHDQLLCSSQFIILFLGAGGIGRRGKADVQAPPLPAPKRAPDAVYEEKTGINQSALYRLTGDKNPLHIDPEFAAAMGFEHPILHGLCTYGYSLRHVLKTYASNDPSVFKSIKSQFSKPVIPGQTLVTEMWQEGRRIHFQTKVKESGDVVIKGAYVDFNADVKVKSTNSNTTTASTDASELKADGIFKEMSSLLASSGDLVKGVNGTFLFQVTKKGVVAGEYFLDFKSSPPSLKFGAPSQKADVTVKISDEDFVLLAEDKLNPTTAFMQGKLKLSGKIILAHKLGDLFKAYGNTRSAPSTGNVEQKTGPVLKARKIFDEVKERIKTEADLASKIKGSFLFQITKANKLAGEMFFDFKEEPIVAVYGPAPTKPDVTIKLEDDDIEAVASGEVNALKLFMAGKLKMSGKVILAQKLGTLFESHASKL